MSSKTKRYDTNPEKELILEGLEFFESSENPDLINPEEIKNLMDKLELKDKMSFIYDLISELCSNKHKGAITKTDFINFLENKLNDTETKEGINTIYSVFTDSKDDTLPLTNFCKVAREIGDIEKDEELKNLLKEADMTGKELNFDEFHEIMTKDKTPNKQKNENKKFPKQKINKFARKKIWKREEKEESEPSEEKSSQRNSHNNQRYENNNNINNTNEEYEPKNVYSYKRVKVEQTKKTLSPKKDEQKEEPVTEKMVTVEEIITEKKVEPPTNNVRYKYKFKNRFRKMQKEDEIKDKEKTEENNEETNNNNNDNNEAKRYHRRYRPNYNNNNIESKNDNINNNITYNRYRRNPNSDN